MVLDGGFEGKGYWKSCAVHFTRRCTLARVYNVNDFNPHVFHQFFPL